MADVTWLSSLTALGVGPLLGAAVGFVGSGAIQRGSDKRAAEREDQARDEERKQRREDERRAFEVSTFSRLPALLQRNARSAAKVLMFDLQSLKEHGRMVSNTPANDEDFAARVEFSLTIGEVLDDHVRGKLEAALQAFSRMEVPPANWEQQASAQLMKERTYQLDVRLPEVMTETSEALTTYRRSLYA